MFQSLHSFPAARIRVSGEFGFILISLAVIGIYYGVLSFIIENMLLRGMSEEEQDQHILSKILLWSTIVLLIADFLLVILPVFDIQLLPFTLLDFI